MKRLTTRIPNRPRRLLLVFTASALLAAYSSPLIAAQQHLKLGVLEFFNADVVTDEELGANKWGTYHRRTNTLDLSGYEEVVRVTDDEVLEELGPSQSRSVS